MIENNIDWIQTVKLQENGYLINGSMSVPKAYGNRHYEDLKIWLEDNTPEPEFTEEEIAKTAIDKKVSEAKVYLTSTDYKVLPDYDGNTTGIVEARAEARNIIRTKEVL